MKAVINEKETPKQPEYPMLMKATGSGRIVLFTSYKTGVVVQTNEEAYWPLGQFSTRWAEDGCFTPFQGSITLSND